MTLRVIIPTAGLGKRLQNLTKDLNKSLITVANKPVISHIIDSFPNSTEYVIPLGYQGEKVKEFLKLAYPKKIFFFVKISKYKGYGSGLGLTLLKSKKYLQKPFIFVSCDTIFKGKIPDLKNNWVGYDNSKLSSSYRKISIKKKIVSNFYRKNNKSKKINKNYIGLAGIKDFKIFWNHMEKNKLESIPEGEVYGLKKLIPIGIKSYKFKWYDTGNPTSLSKAKKNIKYYKYNILDKKGETIWFTKDKKVIKYSSDEKFIRDRVLRQNYLKNYTPKIIKFSKHFYMYNKINGKILSKVITPKILKNLLNFLKKFWKIRETDQNIFKKKCIVFYRDKTLQRIKLFKKLYKNYDKYEIINGKKVSPIANLLAEIDWDKISEGKAVTFHGDLHFENIIYSRNNFIFLDWRQSFAGSLDKGDIYYDLAKIMHGILVSHKKVVQDYYTYKQNKNHTSINIKLNYKYRKLLKIFKEWILMNNFDFNKIIKLTALIYLNSAPLHHYPYSVFLFKLGKLLLAHNNFYKKL